MSKKGWYIYKAVSQPPRPDGRLQRPRSIPHQIALEDANEALAEAQRRFPNTLLTIGTPIV